MNTVAIRTVDKFRTLIAKQAYTPGQIISSIPSENEQRSPTRFTVQIGRDRHMHIGKLAALNHSCSPNVILDTQRMLLIASRDIAKGEDLYYFYPSTEWEMSAPFICLCGASNCIHVVAGARFLPVSTLEQHYIAPHIREMLIELLNKTQAHLDRLTP